MCVLHTEAFLQIRKELFGKDKKLTSNDLKLKR